MSCHDMPMVTRWRYTAHNCRESSKAQPMYIASEYSNILWSLSNRSQRAGNYNERSPRICVRHTVLGERNSLLVATHVITRIRITLFTVSHQCLHKIVINRQHSHKSPTITE